MSALDRDLVLRSSKHGVEPGAVIGQKDRRGVKLHHLQKKEWRQAVSVGHECSLAWEVWPSPLKCLLLSTSCGGGQGSGRGVSSRDPLSSRLGDEGLKKGPAD